MTLRSLVATLALLVLAAAPAHAAGTGSACHVPEAGHEGKVDIITPHITNGDHVEIPYWKFPFFMECTLPKWAPIHVGPLEIDLSPTKHVVMLWIGAPVRAAASRRVGRTRSRR